MKDNYVPRQAAEIQRFVQSFIDAHGYSPSVREIAEGIGMKSPGSIQAMLQQMIRLGLLTGAREKSRTIRVGEAVITPRTETM
ncbi:MAG: LexA binding domain [Thermomicrobiales bacterium]|jgi:repressor LexA|nr:LexA binding domain [Thermomicrobiales bacterium]